MLANLNVNGKRHTTDIEPYWTLAYVLREKLHLTGVKHGCGTGHCGACTVILECKAVPSCLVLASRAEGKVIVTIEGISSDGLHPIQEAFLKTGAATCCGYCVPGMILSAKAFLDRNPYVTEREVEEALSGNLCRCTGYVKMVEAVMHAAEIMRKKR